jgi:hypothetical protein
MVFPVEVHKGIRNQYWSTLILQPTVIEKHIDSTFTIGLEDNVRGKFYINYEKKYRPNEQYR